jgi:UDP-GlcNAc:undecaprenyl-phosphate GlcNAc-1-phosphate transferase
MPSLLSGWSLLALPLALVTSPLARRLAVAASLVDHPRPGRFHAATTPKLGGLAIFVALLPVAFVLGRSGALAVALLAGAGTAFALGLWDDRVDLPWRAKLAGQGAAALLGVMAVLPRSAGVLEGFAPLPLGLFGAVWIVALQNALNFLDNMDGIAGGVSSIALLGLAPHVPAGARELCAAAGLASAGFLPANLSRSRKLFLGDAGSLLLGYFLGTFSLFAMFTAPTWSGVIAPALIVLLPVWDLAFVAVTRTARGQSVAIGGRDHTNHRVYVLLGSVPRTVLAVCTVGAALVALSFVVRALPPALAAGVGIVATTLAALAGALLARVSAPSSPGALREAP